MNVVCFTAGPPLHFCDDGIVAAIGPSSWVDDSTTTDYHSSDEREAIHIDEALPADDVDEGITHEQQGKLI